MWSSQDVAVDQGSHGKLQSCFQRTILGGDNKVTLEMRSFRGKTGFPARNHHRLQPIHASYSLLQCSIPLVYDSLSFSIPTSPPPPPLFFLSFLFSRPLLSVCACLFCHFVCRDLYFSLFISLLPVSPRFAVPLSLKVIC